MTETPLYTATQIQSPFHQEVVVDNYYPTENAEHILHSMSKAIADGAAVVVLTGDEGSGKTMLCHKLDRDPPLGCRTVFFPRTVDSFEDVVRIAASELALAPQTPEDVRPVDVVLDEITTTLIVEGEPLLLMFDEAENIYLATLERIRKMLDRCREAGGRMHVLFAGRNTFLENCEQLSMCDFQNREEYHVHLEPFSASETLDYLLHCCSKLPDVDGQAIFTPEVAENIYQASGGNFRKTNFLAEEAIHKGGDNTSFMVLLENVKEDVAGGNDGLSFIALSKDYIKQYRRYIPYSVVGIGVVLVCLVFLFSRGSDDSQIEPRATVAQKVDPSPAVPPILEKMADEPEPEPEPVAEEVRLSPLEQVALEEQGDVFFQGDNEVTPMPETEIAVQHQTEFSTPVEEESTVSEIVAQKPDVISQPEPAAPPKVIQSEKKTIAIVELERTDKTKKRPGKLPKTTQVTIKEEVKKEKKRNEVREVIATNAHFTVDQLYKKRLMAGTSWYNNEKNDKYTVQIMVLTSDTAEANLKKMLQEDRFRQEAGNFYIFKKLSMSDTLFVFYGEYATIAEARLVQNSLPQFLLNHKPYAISIKGAMAKVRR